MTLSALDKKVFMVSYFRRRKQHREIILKIKWQPLTKGAESSWNVLTEFCRITTSEKPFTIIYLTKIISSLWAVKYPQYVADIITCSNATSVTGDTLVEGPCSSAKWYLCANEEFPLGLLNLLIKALSRSLMVHDIASIIGSVYSKLLFLCLSDTNMLPELLLQAYIAMTGKWHENGTSVNT